MRASIACTGGLFAALTLGAACHTASTALPGRATLQGSVALVPRAGVTPPRAHSGTYGDRRLRDVTLVDYDHPGFVVVYLEGEPISESVGRLTIRSSRFGPRLSPAHQAIGVGGRLTIRNADDAPHTLACPDLGFVRRLGGGEELELPMTVSGAVRCRLLDRRGVRALVFGSPGPYTLASESGRWELRDIKPGRRKVHAWHPRLPAAAAEVDVREGDTQRVDLHIGLHNLRRGNAAD